MPYAFGIVWGCLATVMGACFIIFREPIARRVAQRRARWGQPTGLITQTPAWFAVGGTVFLIAGPLVILGILTGFLHTH